MVSEDNEVSRNLELHALERFYGPVYPDLASAPAEEGILVAIDGSGADPAGYYSYNGSQWSGPWGGASALPDSILDDTTTVSNTETYGFGTYIEAAENASDPKRVDIDADTGTLDERYIKRYTDDFELGDPTDPATDPPTTPEGWAFQPGPGSASVQGGYYYTDTPDPTTSTRSYGTDFVSTTTSDGSTISSSTWALAKEYAVGSGGDTLTVQAYGQPTADYASYNDGATHTDTEAFVGEDDVFVAVEAFDASLQSLALAAPVAYSRPASQQAFDGGRTTALDGTEWMRFSHSATLPAETAFVRVRLQTADGSDTWLSRGDTGSGNVALKLDTYEAGYTSGLRPSAVLQHDHDTDYAPLSHAESTNNPHNVTAGQAGAIRTDAEPTLDVANADTLAGSPESAFAKLTENETISGRWTIDADLIFGTPDGRIQYDVAKNGDPFHIQRDATAAETAITVSGTNVGINDINPSSPLTISGSRVLTTADEGSIDAGTLNGINSSRFLSSNVTNGNWNMEERAVNNVASMELDPTAESNVPPNSLFMGQDDVLKWKNVNGNVRSVF